MKNKKILLGLTTTVNSDWVEKIKEIDKFNIEEIALFLTGINRADRRKLYFLLEKSSIKSIPHVHLRDDMDKSEIKYLISRYKTELFNIHPIGQAKFRFNYIELVDFMDKIYVENTVLIPSQKELDNCGGLCVDFSHWESRKKKVAYAGFADLVKNNKIGCCHISGVRTTLGLFPRDKHLAGGNNDFNYVKKYQDYLPDFISLELENSFEEQIGFKKYIEESLNFEN